MRRVIAFLFITAVFTACAEDFKKDIEPQKFDGVKVEIDSAKWTPALIQIEEHRLTVYESGEIRQVILSDAINTFIVGFLCGCYDCAYYCRYK